MKIITDENEIIIDVEREGEFTSKHTDKPLKWMEVSFLVDGEEAFKEIRKKSEITTISEDGEKLIWQVRELSHSFAQGSPVYELVWDLSEIETLAIETLIFGELEVKPYLYQEEIRDDCLYVTALVKLTNDDFDKLKSIYFGDIYFSVIRRGINDTPKEMRFGKIIWSKDNEVIKFKIYLVDKNHDKEDDNSLGLFEPEISNIKDLLVINTERVLSLLKILEQKNLLTSDEIEQVKKINDEDINSRLLDFQQVTDIDKFNI